MTSIVIIGCGGFGREVFSIIKAQSADGAGWQVDGFLDDYPSEGNLKMIAELGSQLLGPVMQVADMGDTNVVIAVGAPVSREVIIRQLATLPISWPVLIHPDTTVGANVTFDEGVVVAAGARLSTNIAVGRHVHIDQNATVGHDAVIGDFARLNPQVCISGAVDVGDGVLVGANATVLAGIHLGTGSTVGAAACVVRDVAEKTTVKGVPAK